MKRTAIYVAVLALILTSATFASAAEWKYRFEVFGAGSFPQGKDFEIPVPQSSTLVKGQHKWSNGLRGGIRFGSDTGHWGQDIIYSYGANATRIVTPGGDFAIRNRVQQICINAIWYPGAVGADRKATPYVTAGIGGTVYSLPQSVVNQALDPAVAGLGKLREEKVFAFNAGGGVNVRVNNVWGIRVDVRDYMTRAPRYGLPKTSDNPAATVFPVGGVFHQLELSIGFVYYF